jgi:hypothetical protein
MIFLCGEGIAVHINICQVHKNKEEIIHDYAV